MLRYTRDRARPGLVALYDIRPGSGEGQFLQPRSPHGGEMTGDKSIVTIECQQEVICTLSNGDISNDLDGPLTRFSRSWHF